MTNYVIYHRNNSTLGLVNHIDKDGDLDPNYVLLRNTGLTGNNERLRWLKECSLNGCPICSRIFTNKSDYTISDWYNKNVVEPQLKLKQKSLPKIKTKTKWDKLAKQTTNNKQQEIDHPLYEEIKRLFLKGE